VYPRGGRVVIEDLGSTNGTFVNGHQLTRPLELEPNDTVRIGDTELRYRE
jgi:pSer/pThr/pTyr-binding forkhead associated (FHA) protein